MRFFAAQRCTCFRTSHVVHLAVRFVLDSVNCCRFYQTHPLRVTERKEHQFQENSVSCPAPHPQGDFCPDLRLLLLGLLSTCLSCSMVPAVWYFLYLMGYYMKTSREAKVITMSRHRTLANQPDFEPRDKVLDPVHIVKGFASGHGIVGTVQFFVHFFLNLNRMSLGG